MQKELFEEWGKQGDDDDSINEEDEEDDNDDAFERELEGVDGDYFDLLEDYPDERRKKPRKRSASGRSSSSRDEGEIDSEGEDNWEDGEMFYREMEVAVGSVEDDLIEVYDEDGELVGVYDIQEFQKIKTNGGGA